ncbi:MAG: hypothetical protein R6T99_10500 [Bacteroidales bacterium]
MKKSFLYKLAIPLILIICIWVSSNMSWGDQRQGRIIKADGNGYYAYLPAVFIYHDLSFGFFDSIVEKEYHPNLSWDYRYVGNGFVTNKYYAGTALAILPFFLIAHGLSICFGYPADGYSALYLIFINIAAIFYLGMALLFLRKLLKRIPELSEKAIVLILAALVFGTNLFHYTVEEPSLSHVYSLAFVTAFIYYARKFFERPGAGPAILCATLLGMIILIRPVNGIILLLVPFIAGSLPCLKKGLNHFLRRPAILLGSVLAGILVLSVQLIIYKIQSGSFWVYSYGNEGFDFLDPHCVDFLFSYRKGMFVYTPLLFLSLAGGYFLFRKSRYRFFTLFGFLAILIYVLSSWWQWYYGGSFSQRVMIEYYAVFALLLGYLLSGNVHRIIRKAAVILILVLSLFTFIQSEQYRIAHIHWSEMDKEKYWKAFMRVDKLIRREPVDQ